MVWNVYTILRQKSGLVCHSHVCNQYAVQQRHVVEGIYRTNRVHSVVAYLETERHRSQLVKGEVKIIFLTHVRSKDP